MLLTGFLLCLAALARPATSQAPAADPGGRAVYVVPGDRIRLTSPLVPPSLTGRPWLEGSLLAVDSLGLKLVSTRGDSLAIGLSAITRLQVHRPTGAAPSDGAGAASTLVGFLAGAAVGAMACSSGDQTSWVSFLPEACAFGTGLGGAMLGSHLARGPRDDAAWRPVELPLRWSLTPGRQPWLALRLTF